MAVSFGEKLAVVMARHSSLWYLGLDPNPELLPAALRPLYDRRDRSLTEALAAWLITLIERTHPYLCAYKVSLGFYTALGPPGLELLAQVLAAIPPSMPVILDAKHSDLNSSSVLAQTAFTDWRVDAITLSPYLGQELAARFLMYLDKGVLISCYDANPSAQTLQAYPNPTAPFYLHLMQECQGWASPAQLGLEIGASDPALLAQVRQVAPDRWILARSIWADQRGSQADHLEGLLAAGLDAQSGGLLLPVNQDVLGAPDPGALVQSLRDQTQGILDRRPAVNPTCPLWVTQPATTPAHPHTALILQLFDVGFLQFGDHVQASGAVFPYYIDLRRIISAPQVFEAVIQAYAKILETLPFDRIAGIPYGSLPTASGLALRLNRPLIFPRKEVKAHGARRLVEGNYQAGEVVVVVDDILISGNSALEGAAKLQSCQLQVRDIVVLIDHGSGAGERLAQQGYQAHAVLTLGDIREVLYGAGRIDAHQLALLVE